MQSKTSTNKIVKALKCCVKKNCSTCPLGAAGNPYCEEDIKAAAADIIKNLQEDVKGLTETIEDKNEMISDLYNQISEMYDADDWD